MKKIALIASALAVCLVAGTNAFSGTINNETAGAGKAVGLSGLNLNFSPGVFGQYTTESDGDNEQWYSIGTYHGGGHYLYATSQQQTSVWKVERDAPDEFSDNEIPDTKTDSESDAEWETAGFSK